MKPYRQGLTALLCLSVLLFCAPAFAASDAPSGAPKAAVLIVAFGTSVEKARASYAAVEKEVRAACPGAEIRWAWSAHSLLQSGGASMLSPQEALARLATEGVKRVSVLSLHVIPGQEYTNLAQTARAFEGLPKGIEEIRLGPPLLSGTESLGETAALLLKTVPAGRKADEAVLFVGHGTHHPAGVYYPALQYYLGRLDKKAFVGTVEGDLDLKRISADLKASGVKKVWMAPLMTVAGDHAMNDLFGDGPDSWKSAFARQGIMVETIDRGLGEYPDFAARWAKGLKSAGE